MNRGYPGHMISTGFLLLLLLLLSPSFSNQFPASTVLADNCQLCFVTECALAYTIDAMEDILYIVRTPMREFGCPYRSVSSYDISNPRNPIELTTSKFTERSFDVVHGSIAVQLGINNSGSYPDIYGKTRILDVERLDEPELLHEFDITGHKIRPNEPTQFYIVNSHGLLLLDISSSKNPHYHYVVNEEDNRDIIVDDRHIYVLDKERNLKIIEIREDGDYELLSTTSTGISGTAKILCNGSNLYIPFGNGSKYGIELYDVGDKRLPSLTDSFEMDTISGPVESIARYENRLYVSHGGAGSITYTTGDLQHQLVSIEKDGCGEPFYHTCGEIVVYKRTLISSYGRCWSNGCLTYFRMGAVYDSGVDDVFMKHHEADRRPEDSEIVGISLNNRKGRFSLYTINGTYIGEANSPRPGTILSQEKHGIGILVPQSIQYTSFAQSKKALLSPD